MFLLFCPPPLYLVTKWYWSEETSAIEEDFIRENVFQAWIWLANTGERCLSLCSPQMKQRVYSSVHKDYCRRTRAGAARAAMPREPEGSETRPKHARIRGTRGKQELPALYYWWGGEKGKGGREERESRENMLGPTRWGINKVRQKKHLQIEVLILIWSGINHINDATIILTDEDLNCVFVCVGVV